MDYNDHEHNDETITTRQLVIGTLSIALSFLPEAKHLLPHVFSTRVAKSYETPRETRHRPPNTNFTLIRCTIAQLCPAVRRIVA